MKGRFLPLASFEGPDRQPYRLLPFRFMRQSDGAVLLTNDAGEYEFVSSSDFGHLTSDRLCRTDATYLDLKSKHFLTDSNSTLPHELLATKIRSRRSFLSGFTTLHIVVVTLRCDHSCPYCQVSRVTQDKVRYDMSMDTAARAVEWIFRSPAQELKIEFQGGEPTLNWPVIEFVVGAACRRATLEGRRVEFVIATNLSQISDAMLAFCREHHIHLSTSLDGPADLHNANRPRPGADSYQRFRANLDRARAALGHDQVSALMTTTAAALPRPRDIVDEYVRLGFDSIFLRAISPYGFALRLKHNRTDTAKRFITFYAEGLEYIIELNRQGVRIAESYAQILLRKMLTSFPTGYVDLQSPAGAAIGVLVYNYDGDLYASDEGRMLAETGDYSFRLGSLAHDRYSDVMTGERVRALVDNSCLETLPGCSWCAYAPFCGADPVLNWATQGDIVGHRPTGEFCARQTAIFDLLFGYLRRGDAFTRRLFFQWATQ